VSGRESGWEGVDFKGFRFYPNFGCRERGGDAAKTPRFCPEDTKNLTQRPQRTQRGELFDYFPKLRDTRIAHAKAAKDAKGDWGSSKV